MALDRFVEHVVRPYLDASTKEDAPRRLPARL